MSKEQSPNSSNISNEGETVDISSVATNCFMSTGYRRNDDYKSFVDGFIKGTKYQSSASDKRIVELIEGRIKELENATKSVTNNIATIKIQVLTDLLKAFKELK